MILLNRTLSTLTAFLIGLGTLAVVTAAHAEPADRDVMLSDISAAFATGAVDSLTQSQLRENFVAEPAIQVEIQATRDDEIDIVRINDKMIFQVGPPQISDEDRAEYERLSVQEKEKFHNERRAQLKKLAQALAVTKSSSSFVVAIKNKIIRNKSKVEANSESISSYEKSAILNYYNSRQWKKARNIGKTFNVRGFSAVVGFKLLLGFAIPQSTLEKHGKNASPKLMKVVQFLQKYSSLGGARFLAVDIAYNSENKTLILKIDKQKEKMDGGFAAEATFATKLFVYSATSTKMPQNEAGEANDGANSKQKVEYGSSYYPPSLPIPLLAGGFGAETGPDRMSAGLYIALGPDAFPVGFSRGAYEKVTIYLAEVQAPVAYAKRLVALAGSLTRIFEPELSYAQQWNKTPAAHQCRDFFY